jgi:hypothetical protein
MSLIVTATRKLLVFANSIMKPMDLNDYLKLNIDVIVDLARKYVPTDNKGTNF